MKKPQYLFHLEKRSPRAGSFSRSWPLRSSCCLTLSLSRVSLAIEIRDGNLYGSLIDIFRNGSTVMLLAIGMTLVIATGGVDLSVGAVMAIAASVAAILMNPIRTGERIIAADTGFRHRSQLHLPAALGGDPGHPVRGYPVWFVEWDAGRLRENPADGGHADPDDRRTWHRPVDHQRAADPDLLRALCVHRAGLGYPAISACISWHLSMCSPGL